MVGRVAFLDDAMHASETVDHKMVGALPAYVIEQGFPDAPQRAIVLGREGGLRAFGGMKDDAGRIGTADGGGAGGARGECQVGARVVGDGVAAVNP